MQYDFLEKAKLQPDLQDFCSYLIEPLNKITYIYNFINNEKNLIDKNTINYKLNSILKADLPQIVDDFCKFPFEFRNLKKINNEITPKELLLKNTAKIIEEIQLIEEDINHQNIKNALITTKIISNKGFQPQISLQPGKLLENKKITLENKFDYYKFKLTKSKEKIQLTNNNLNEKSLLDNIDNENKNGFLVFNLLTGFFIAIFLCLLTYKYSNDVFLNSQIENETNSLKLIVNSTDRLFLGQKDYTYLSDKLLIQSNSVPSSMKAGNSILSSFGNISISPENLNNKKNSAYSITYNNIPQKACVKFVSRNLENFIQIKVNNYNLKNNETNVFDAAGILSSCALTEKSSISFLSGFK